MVTKTQVPSRAPQQVSKLRQSEPTPGPARGHDHASIDCLGAMEEAMLFFREQALQASDAKTAKKFARDADRIFKMLARYHPLYFLLSR
jgi:hypothetical protein